MEWREDWLGEYLADAGCMGWYFGSAWGVAGLIFGPQRNYLEDEDRVVEWLYRVRGVLGVAVITYASIRYHHAGGVAQAYDTIAVSFDWAVLFLLAAGLPAMLAVAWLTRPGKRRAALTQMRYPALAMGGYIGTFYLMVGLFSLPKSGVGWVIVPLELFVVAAALWLMVYCVHAAYLISTGLFRLGEGHPLLAPVIGTAATWTVAIRDLITGGSNGEPGSVALMLLLGGPASVTALSVAEVLRLRRMYPADFPFRSGP